MQDSPAQGASRTPITSASVESPTESAPEEPATNPKMVVAGASSNGHREEAVVRDERSEAPGAIVADLRTTPTTNAIGAWLC